MADITSFLNTIKTAIYGRDMRSALHDSIKAVNDALESEVKRSTAKDTSHDESIKNLDERLQQEANNRSSADDGLSKRITDEANARSSADTALGEQIDDEAVKRAAADDALGQRVADEVMARSAADNALSDRLNIEIKTREELNERFKPVEEMAHTHENKDILDGIDADRVRKWDDGSEGAITLGEYLEHLAEADRQFELLWGAMGLKLVDGGWFGMEQIDAPLDGGLFEDTVFTPLDCGDFGKFIPSGGIGDVVDGGTY